MNLFREIVRDYKHLGLSLILVLLFAVKTQCRQFNEETKDDIIAKDLEMEDNPSREKRQMPPSQPATTANSRHNSQSRENVGPNSLVEPRTRKQKRKYKHKEKTDQHKNTDHIQLQDSHSSNEESPSMSRRFAEWGPGPDGDCIALSGQTEFLHIDEDGYTCVCPLCLVPLYMRRPCNCLSNGQILQEAECAFPPRDGPTITSFMNGTNKCSSPYLCSVCAEPMITKKPCQSDADAECTCPPGAYESSEAECSYYPLCNAGYGLHKSHHLTDSKYPSYSCRECDEGKVQPFNNTARACRKHHNVECPVEKGWTLIAGNSTHDPLCKVPESPTDRPALSEVNIFTIKELSEDLKDQEPGDRHTIPADCDCRIPIDCPECPPCPECQQENSCDFGEKFAFVISGIVIGGIVVYTLLCCGKRRKIGAI